MKKSIVILLVFYSFAIIAAEKVNELEIGDKALLTDVNMQEVTGKSISLNDVKKENGLVVMFSCNQCPFVLRWEDRYNEIKSWADKNDVGMVVLNSNYQNRSGGDSFEAMKTKAKEKGYNFYYAVDKESKLANAFGGKTTPHVFLFDGDFKLAYKGAIDDNSKSAASVEKTYLKDAIIQVGAGKNVALAETPPVGCGIKRKVE